MDVMSRSASMPNLSGRRTGVSGPLADTRAIQQFPSDSTPSESRTSNPIDQTRGAHIDASRKAAIEITLLTKQEVQQLAQNLYRLAQQAGHGDVAALLLEEVLDSSSK